MEIEPAASAAPAPPDKRPLMPEPPPVRVTAIDDVHVVAAAGAEPKLDSFYLELLKFERDGSAEDLKIAYRAENFRLIFDIVEPPIERMELRPILVEVPLLAEVEAKLLAMEYPYQRVRGLLGGSDSLALQDPAGNWISISEIRAVR